MNIKIKEKETSTYIDLNKLVATGISNYISEKLWDTDTILSKEIGKIEKIEFETYDEYLKLVEDDPEMYYFNNEIVIGQAQEDELEINVDNRENCLVNVTKLDYDDNIGGVKTYYFNANLSSIATYFNKHASYFIESTLRDKILSDINSYEYKKFNKIMEEEAESFFIYNRGITLITNNDVKVRENNPNIFLESPYIIEGIELIKNYLHRNKKDSVEIPIRIMNIKSSKGAQIENLVNISQKMLVSPMIETESSLRTKLMHYNLLNKDSGLNIKDGDEKLRQYLTFYTCVVMQKPGIAKLKIKEILQNCFWNTIKEEISLDELISNKAIFIEPNKKIKSNLFENGSITSLDFHKFLSCEVFEQYQKIEKNFEKRGTNPGLKNSFLSFVYFIYILKYGFEKPSNEKVENKIYPFVLKYMEKVIREDIVTQLEKLEELDVEEREFILNNVTDSFSNEYIEKQNLKKKAKMISSELDDFIENTMVSQFEYFVFNKFKEYVITEIGEMNIGYFDEALIDYIEEFMISDYNDLMNSEFVYEYIKRKYLENMEAFDYLFELNSDIESLTITKILKATKLSNYDRETKIYEFIIEAENIQLNDFEKKELVNNKLFSSDEISDLKINAWIKALKLCGSFDKADEIWMLGEYLLNSFKKGNIKKLADIIDTNDQLYRRSGAKNMFSVFNEQVGKLFNEDEIKIIQKQNFAMETLEFKIPK